MDIWITRCNKQAICNHCHQPITTGSAMVSGRLWQKRPQEDPPTRRWVINFHWHVSRESDNICCWIEQGLAYLLLHPQIETRGRKRIILPADSRKLRLQLLRKRARIIQRLKHITNAIPDHRDIDEIINLGSKLEEIKEQIAEVGGIPESW